MNAKTNPIDQLKDIDSKAKPAGADNEWITAHAYYDDVARDLTSAMLVRLGAGISNNPNPLEVALLRRIIDRLAVVYDRAPQRWVTDLEGVRLPEDSDAHKAMIRVYERAQFDLAMRRVDRLRALMRQVVVRFYPSDARAGVVVRIFEPYNVIRQPNAGAPDQLDSDHQFALRLSGTESQSGADEVWEHWTRNESGGWSMTVVDQSGGALAEQPFAASGVINPYAELPAMIIYDDYNGGQPWLSPRCSRTSWVSAINALANDIWTLVLHEAHQMKIVNTDNPHDVPKEHGPGKVWALPKDAEAYVLAGNAQLAAVQEILEGFVRLWTISEDLPASEFDKSKQVVTGATLKVQNAPLIARREAQVPLAIADEAVAYRKLRAVHNLHIAAGAKWGLPPLDEETALEVEIGDMEIPTDIREVQEAGARSLALGTKSTIDLIMAENNCARANAIKIYSRVKEDNAMFPPRVAMNEEGVVSGPQMAAGEVPNGPEEMAGTASVVDAVAAGSEDAPVEAVNLGSSPVPTQVDSAQDTALNGAQVTAAKEIVEAVASGSLPRDSGVAMLIEFFNLAPERAEKIMGSVGKGFKPKADAPDPKPGGFGEPAANPDAA